MATSLRSLQTARLAVPATQAAARPPARWLIGGGLLAALLLSGCSAVAPWERGDLARPHMAVDPAPLRSALRHHVHSSREAAAMGGTADGGGCGCY